jgi:hypothetical protein
LIYSELYVLQSEKPTWNAADGKLKTTQYAGDRIWVIGKNNFNEFAPAKFGSLIGRSK